MGRRLASWPPCPCCRAPVRVSERYRAWACSDPACVLAQSDAGPGGGYPLDVLVGRR